MADKNLTRIAALLRKAEGTDNEHEADAYLQAAQRLATLAAVDLAVARSHAETRERRVAPTQRSIDIGEAGKRGLRTYVHLFLVIGRANDLLCDVARNSTRVFAYGFAADIDAAEALYSSLVVQMVRASDSFVKSGAHAEELITRRVKVEVPVAGRRSPVTRYVHESKPVHATTARINFQQAFAARIGLRLQEARNAARAEAVAGDVAEVPTPTPLHGGPGEEGGRAASVADRTGSVALVLRAREVELLDHYRATSTARGSWAGGRATAGYSEAAQRAGDRAGRTARLGDQRAVGGARKSLDG